MRSNTQARPAIVLGGASPDYVRRMQQLRRSGAAGSHGSRADRRARDRGAAKRRAVSRELSSHGG
jgi:hypothetical protein